MATNIESLKNYISETKECMSLFDVPLHYNLYNASNSNGQYDMSKIFENTLIKEKPELAVTFVDNHDIQTGQALCSWVQDWFYPLAYALILLRKDGYPCVFYGDYCGIPHDSIEYKQDMIENLLKAKKYFAYGRQNDYFDDQNIIGWTREGDYEHSDSGMPVIMSDNAGNGIFYCQGGSVSVWIKKNNIYENK